MAVFNIKKLIRAVGVKKKAAEIAIKTLDKKREKLVLDFKSFDHREFELKQLLAEAVRRDMVGSLQTKRAWRDFAQQWQDEKVANARF